jgi:hypothetical protein
MKYIYIQMQFLIVLSAVTCLPMPQGRYLRSMLYQQMMLLNPLMTGSMGMGMMSPMLMGMGIRGGGVM